MPNPGIDRDRIKPEYLMNLSDPLGAVYQAIEHDLMVMTAKAFKLDRLNSDSARWRTVMLGRLGALNRSGIQLLAHYSGQVSKAAKNAIRTAVADSIAVVEPELSENIRAGLWMPQPDATIERVANAYYAQAIQSCNMVNTVMLNSTLQTYRDIVDNPNVLKDIERRLAYDQEELNAEAGAVIIGAKSRNQALFNAIDNMAKNGLVGFYDRSGRAWSPEAYINMDIRTTTANAAREAVFERNREYGNNLISVSAHAGARPLCYPYQGGVYSTDGYSGDVEDLNGHVYHVIPLASTSYGEPAGLFGINCGHFSYPFIAGKSLVRADVQPQKANDAQYERNQAQRQMEREIRKLKTRADCAEAGGNPEGAKALRQKVSTATAELKEWCADNGQDYKPDRLRVYIPND